MIRQPRRTLACASLLVVCACGDDGSPSEKFTHPEGAIQGTKTLTARPFGAAISPMGVGLVTQLDNATLRVINVEDGSLGSSITVGQTPTRVAFDPTGATAYVSNQSSDNLGVISMSTLTQTTTIPLPGSPFAVAVSPKGDRVYVGTTTDRVYVINPATRAIVDSAQVGAIPNGITFSSDGSRYWVANAGSGTVTEVTTATNDVARTFTVGGTPQDVAVQRDGARLFVSNEAGRVDVVTLSSGAIGSPIQLGASAFGMVITPDQSQLLVAISGGHAVRIISTATLAPTGSVEAGVLPRRIAINARGTRALVASEDGTVTVIR